MPVHTCQPTQNPRIQSDNEFLHAFKDQEFDQIYPEDISRLSPCHWSPVAVCQMAAQLLVVAPRHYDDYTLHVQQQLEREPMATRVITCFGSRAEVPERYTGVKTACEGMLKLWVKTRPSLKDD
ncbi:MAG: hypothetical protein ACKVY0_24795 [Prosthecobacter sp.]|uniref:hypothetical protein n=1 Tax=Prosthecobacter sp. TaxID=1965333 RepID=UPI0039006CE8